MATLPPDYRLKSWQTAHPMLWVTPPPVRALPHVPDTSDAVLAQVFGSGNARRLKSWGHQENGVHWLATRSGTALHDDIGYHRYSHHLLLRNDGFRINGLLEDVDIPLLVPGTLYCLDTWSPHQVLLDVRFGRHDIPLYKVQVVVDRDVMLSSLEAWALLAPFLGEPTCLTGFTERKGRSPGMVLSPAKAIQQLEDR